MQTVPIDLAASRYESNDVLAQVADLDRRILELEDRLYSRENSSKSNISSINGQFYLNANGLNIINQGGVTVGTWQVDGDIFFGTNVNNPPTGVTIAIFNAAQTYNSESVGVGDMLFGNNSSGKANMLWDASAGILYFRGGTTNQVYINTTGDLYAGGGKVRLNANGLEVRNDSSTQYVKLYNTNITTYTGAVGYLNIDQNDPAGHTYGTMVIGIWHNANNQSNLYCFLNEVDIAIQKGGSWKYTLESNYDYTRINTPLNLSAIPTSSAGLSAGDVWNSSGVLHIV